LRLALLLVEGSRKVRDQKRALALLKGMDGARASGSTRALARLLTQVLHDRTSARGKIVGLKHKLQQADEHVKELERQLQALTDIEQNIQQRETPVKRKGKE